jgi:transposase-like protein
MSNTCSQVEVIGGVARRRRFSTELELAVVAETMQPGMSVSYVARRHGLSRSLIFRWRRLMSEGGKAAVRADERGRQHPKSGGCKSACANRSRSWAARRWKSRSSKNCAVEQHSTLAADACAALAEAAATVRG